MFNSPRLSSRPTTVAGDRQRDRRAYGRPLGLTLIAIGMVLFPLAACTDPASTGNAPGAADNSPGASNATTETVSSGATESNASSGASTAPTALPASVAQATARVAAMLPDFVTVFGVPGIEPGQLMLVNDVAVDASGNLYVSDSKGVTKFDAAGNFVTLIGEGELKSAAGMTVGPGDRLYVTGDGPAVWVFGPDGKKLGTIGSEGTGKGQLGEPVDIAADKAGNLYVADSGHARIEKFSADGKHLASIGEPGEQKGQFTKPRAVAVDSAGRILVGLGDDFLVQRFSADGEYLDSFGQGHADESMWRIGGIAVDDNDNYYLSMTTSHRVQGFSGGDTPKLKWEFGELGIGNSRFNSPLGLAVQGGSLYVADQQNNQVQRFTLK